VSWGELIDKLTILEIKMERMQDPGKVANVRREWEALLPLQKQALLVQAGLSPLQAQLKAVNEALWTIEDEIRDCERHKDFGPRFVALARAVYHENDGRALVKRQINELLGSDLVEEKSYQAY
jgi:hypothetical protein